MTDLAAFNPFDPGFVENPFAAYAALCEQAPVYEVPALGFFIVTSHACVSEVIGDAARFSSKVGAQAGGLGAAGEIAEILRDAAPPVDTLLTSDPPDHIRYRSLVSRAFSANRVKQMESYIRQVAADLVAGFANDGAVEFLQRYAVPLPLRIIADQLGVPAADLDLFKKWSDDSVAPLSGMITPDRAVECARSLVELHRYMTARIDERRAQPESDILTDLVEARLDGAEPLNLPEILSILQQFLVAGNETTTNVLGSAMMLLLQNPEQLAAVQEDRSLIPNMCEEALRLESPVQGLFRVATDDTEVAEVKIPKGARLAVMYAAANRDPAVFEDPNRFDVRRPNTNEHLAFGHGEHFCIGAALARRELTVAFETLFDRLDGFRLAPGNDFAHEPSFILRGLKALHIEFDKR